jgi:VanZ family protein
VPDWLFGWHRFYRNCRAIARALAWIGILAILGLSFVPAVARPVTGLGQQFEHFTAFALTAAAIAFGYDLSPARLLLLVFLFCGGIELLQVPLSTRHARLSDFIVDVVASCVAIGLVIVGKYFLGLTQKPK